MSDIKLFNIEGSQVKELEGKSFIVENLLKSLSPKVKIK